MYTHYESYLSKNKEMLKNLVRVSKQNNRHWNVKSWYSLSIELKTKMFIGGFTLNAKFCKQVFKKLNTWSFFKSDDSNVIVRYFFLSYIYKPLWKRDWNDFLEKNFLLFFYFSKVIGPQSYKMTCFWGWFFPVYDPQISS